MTTNSKTQAATFFDTFGVQTENNGWTGTDLTRHPNENEATELSDPSSWGWRFSDGSELWLVNGQMTSSVSVH